MRNPVYVVDLEGNTRTCWSLWKASRIARQVKRGRRGHVPLAHPRKAETRGRLKWAGIKLPRRVSLARAVLAKIKKFWQR